MPPALSAPSKPSKPARQEGSSPSPSTIRTSPLPPSLPLLLPPSSLLNPTPSREDQHQDQDHHIRLVLRPLPLSAAHIPAPVPDCLDCVVFAQATQHFCFSRSGICLSVESGPGPARSEMIAPSKRKRAALSPPSIPKQSPRAPAWSGPPEMFLACPNDPATPALSRSPRL
jgi:hypothetical protein